jgi:hypothetical protein
LASLQTRRSHIGKEQVKGYPHIEILPFQRAIA